MKYNVGDKFKVYVEVVKMDEDDDELPYYVSIVGNTYPDGLWLTEKTIEQAFSEADPEAKKEFIKRQIESLQKELEQIQ